MLITITDEWLTPGRTYMYDDNDQVAGFAQCKDNILRIAIFNVERVFIQLALKKDYSDKTIEISTPNDISLSGNAPGLQALRMRFRDLGVIDDVVEKNVSNLGEIHTHDLLLYGEGLTTILGVKFTSVNSAIKTGTFETFCPFKTDTLIVEAEAWEQHSRLSFKDTIQANVIEYSSIEGSIISSPNKESLFELRCETSWDCGWTISGDFKIQTEAMWMHGYVRTYKDFLVHATDELLLSEDCTLDIGGRYNIRCDTTPEISATFRHLGNKPHDAIPSSLKGMLETAEEKHEAPLPAPLIPFQPFISLCRELGTRIVNAFSKEEETEKEITHEADLPPDGLIYGKEGLVYDGLTLANYARLVFVTEGELDLLGEIRSPTKSCVFQAFADTTRVDCDLAGVLVGQIQTKNALELQQELSAENILLTSTEGEIKAAAAFNAKQKLLVQAAKGFAASDKIEVNAGSFLFQTEDITFPGRLIAKEKATVLTKHHADLGQVTAENFNFNARTGIVRKIKSNDTSVTALGFCNTSSIDCDLFSANTVANLATNVVWPRALRWKNLTESKALMLGVYMAAGIAFPAAMATFAACAASASILTILSQLERYLSEKKLPWTAIFNDPTARQMFIQFINCTETAALSAATHASVTDATQVADVHDLAQNIADLPTQLGADTLQSLALHTLGSTAEHVTFLKTPETIHWYTGALNRLSGPVQDTRDFCTDVCQSGSEFFQHLLHPKDVQTTHVRHHQGLATHHAIETSEIQPKQGWSALQDAFKAAGKELHWRDAVFLYHLGSLILQFTGNKVTTQAVIDIALSIFFIPLNSSQASVIDLGTGVFAPLHSGQKTTLFGRYFSVMLPGSGTENTASFHNYLGITCGTHGTFLINARDFDGGGIAPLLANLSINSERAHFDPRQQMFKCVVSTPTTFTMTDGMRVQGCTFNVKRFEIPAHLHTTLTQTVIQANEAEVDGTATLSRSSLLVKGKLTEGAEGELSATDSTVQANTAKLDGHTTLTSSSLQVTKALTEGAEGDLSATDSAVQANTAKLDGHTTLTTSSLQVTETLTEGAEGDISTTDSAIQANTAKLDGRTTLTTSSLQVNETLTEGASGHLSSTDSVMQAKNAKLDGEGTLTRTTVEAETISQGAEGHLRTQDSKLDADTVDLKGHTEHEDTLHIKAKHYRLAKEASITRAGEHSTLVLETESPPEDEGKTDTELLVTDTHESVKERVGENHGHQNRHADYQLVISHDDETIDFKIAGDFIGKIQAQRLTVTEEQHYKDIALEAIAGDVLLQAKIQSDAGVEVLAAGKVIQDGVPIEAQDTVVLLGAKGVERLAETHTEQKPIKVDHGLHKKHKFKDVPVVDRPTISGKQVVLGSEEGDLYSEAQETTGPNGTPCVLVRIAPNGEIVDKRTVTLQKSSHTHRVLGAPTSRRKNEDEVSADPIFNCTEVNDYATAVTIEDPQFAEDCVHTFSGEYRTYEDLPLNHWMQKKSWGAGANVLGIRLGNEAKNGYAGFKARDLDPIGPDVRDFQNNDSTLGKAAATSNLAVDSVNAAAQASDVINKGRLQPTVKANVGRTTTTETWQTLPDVELPDHIVGEGVKKEAFWGFDDAYIPSLETDAESIEQIGPRLGYSRRVTSTGLDFDGLLGRGGLPSIGGHREQTIVKGEEVLPQTFHIQDARVMAERLSQTNASLEIDTLHGGFREVNNYQTPSIFTSKQTRFSADTSGQFSFDTSRAFSAQYANKPALTVRDPGDEPIEIEHFESNGAQLIGLDAQSSDITPAVSRSTEHHSGLSLSLGETGGPFHFPAEVNTGHSSLMTEQTSAGDTHVLKHSREGVHWKLPLTSREELGEASREIAEAYETAVDAFENPEGESAVEQRELEAKLSAEAAAELHELEVEAELQREVQVEIQEAYEQALEVELDKRKEPTTVEQIDDYLKDYISDPTTRDYVAHIIDGGFVEPIRAIRELTDMSFQEYAAIAVDNYKLVKEIQTILFPTSLDEYQAALDDLGQRASAAKDSWDSMSGPERAGAAASVLVPSALTEGTLRSAFFAKGVGKAKALTFPIRSPETYRSIKASLRAGGVEPSATLQEIENGLRQELDDMGIDPRDYSIESRTKSEYSISKKLAKYNLSPDQANQLHDTLAVRAIVPTEEQIYELRERMRTRWRKTARPDKDYVKNRKESGYQSVHTTRQTDSGETFEAQLRTHKMHAAARSGSAAHWKYKHGIDGYGTRYTPLFFGGLAIAHHEQQTDEAARAVSP